MKACKPLRHAGRQCPRLRNGQVSGREEVEVASEYWQNHEGRNYVGNLLGNARLIHTIVGFCIAVVILQRWKLG